MAWSHVDIPFDPRQTRMDKGLQPLWTMWTIKSIVCQRWNTGALAWRLAWRLAWPNSLYIYDISIVKIKDSPHSPHSPQTRMDTTFRVGQPTPKSWSTHGPRMVHKKTFSLPLAKTSKIPLHYQHRQPKRNQTMNYSKLEAASVAMAANAKNGTLKLNGQTYTFTFTSEWIYEVTDESGEVVTRFNTKKLTVARQWLKEWFA